MYSALRHSKHSIKSFINSNAFLHGPSQSALYHKPRVISGCFSQRFLSVHCVDVPLLISPAAGAAVKVFLAALSTPGVCRTAVHLKGMIAGTEMAETESKIL